MPNQAYGIWAEAVAELMSYRYLGCSSTLGNGFAAEAAMSIRSDMRHAGGRLAAPVGIAMLDTAGIAVDRHWQLALTRAEIQRRRAPGHLPAGRPGAPTRKHAPSVHRGETPSMPMNPDDWLALARRIGPSSPPHQPVSTTSTPGRASPTWTCLGMGNRIRCC